MDPSITVNRAPRTLDPACLLDLLEGPHDAVILYGSYARGDQTPRSDIDLLQIVPDRRASYRRGRLSVTTTTAESLRALAVSGSLFVLHLRQEGVVLRDTFHVLEDILASYRPPQSYTPLGESLRLAAGILDVDDRGFQSNPRGFTQLSIYLLRTTLYLRCAESGRPLFSMREVAENLRDRRLFDVFCEREERAGDVDFFLRVRALLEQYLGAPARNEFGSIEALAVQAYERSPLASALALRLLGGASMEYEDLLPDGIAL
jgi:hypothetical protein